MIDGRYRFLVTGGAGFIGSHIVKSLVELNQRVTVMDDLSTGEVSRLEDVKDKIQWKQGSILDMDLLKDAMVDIDFCLHLAAIPSVPRSIDNPLRTNLANVTGTLNVFWAAQQKTLNVWFMHRLLLFMGTIPKCRSKKRQPPRRYLPMRYQSMWESSIILCLIVSMR